MFSASKTKQVSGGAANITLTKSLRFRSSASAYLSRTPASTTNRQTWTWSGWVKRGTLGATSTIFGYVSNDASQQHVAWFKADDTLQFFIYSSGYTLNLITTQVFKDVSAWYHIVIAQNTTQATDTNRVKIYVNGVQITSFSTASYPTQNLNGYINLNVPIGIGSFPPALGSYFDGYQTDVYLIDGQQLTPSSFGSTSATTGVWQPAAYTGTYGTNGFHLTFANTASTTTLGYDTSGNGNNFTTNNISLTAGSTYDSMNDVPTLTSATAGNYAVVNPLLGSTATLSNGNLNIVVGTSATKVLGTIGMSSGKWYWEYSYTDLTGDGTSGIATAQTTIAAHVGLDAYSWGYNSGTGNKVTNSTSTAYGASYTTGNIIGVAFDADAGTLIFYKNNTSQGTAFTGLTSGPYFPAFGDNAGGSSSTLYVNFGQQGFTYTPPSGYVALNTYNLPTPNVVKGNQYMDTSLYTGTGASLSVTNATSFKPDLVWIKSRSASTDNKLTDSVRGTTKALISNTTGAETTDTNGLTSFNSNGFTLGTDTVYNNSGATYVGWQWQAGQGSNVSNTNGSITSTVSASTTAGFSVVTYTGTGVAGTIGHGLGVAPSMIIVKSRSITNDWPVYHSYLGNGTYALLDTSGASSSSSTIWNATSPTSSVFSVGINTVSNTVTATYVAYCFASISGFSAFGNYTGNGSSTGPFVYCGFEPSFVLIKNTTSAGPQWWIIDNKRNAYNSANLALPTSLNLSDQTISNLLNFLSNGFQIQTTNGDFNTSGSNYIYAAFAQNPFKYSNAY